MDQDAFRQRLMQVFLGELQEHVQALERDLLALEQQDKGNTGPLVESLFRTAHTLKGAARAVSSSLLESTADGMEYLFDQLRNNKVTLTPPLLRLLFDTIDALKEAAAETDGRTLEAADGPLARHFPELKKALRQEVNRSNYADQMSPPVSPGKTVRTAPDPAPAVPSPPEATERARSAAATDKKVRVNVGHLQNMLALSGEMLIARQRLARSETALSAYVEGLEFSGGATGVDPKVELSQLKALVQALRADRRRLEQLSVQLQSRVRQTGMISFAEACEGLPRAVRNLVKDLGKEVELQLVGGDIEIDRAIVDGIRESLLHLVRNALAHGIELPVERKSRSKPVRGRVTVSASLRGGGVVVRISDDGRGLNIQAIRQRISDLPLVERAADVAVISEDAAISHIFRPGFSTQERVDAISGRGVGLDVVNNAVAALGGSIAVATEQDKGTRFELRLPLTLSVLPVVLLRCAGQTYAFDTRSVVCMLRVSRSELKAADGHDVILQGDKAVRIFVLCEILQAGAFSTTGTQKLNVVLLQAGNSSAAFIVDELLAEQPVSVKSMGSRFRQMKQITGVSVTGDGELALIVNAEALIGHALQQTSPDASARMTAGPETRKRRLLIADDSLTTRTLMKGILESENFFVTAAADGRQAWDILQQGFFDLVVSDVEMPHLDGVELTAAIRSSPRFRGLPVILVTGLADEHDRQRGMAAGANAYLIKSSFDQSELIRSINQLI